MEEGLLESKRKSSFYNLKSIRWRITLLILLVIMVHITNMLWITKQSQHNANQAALEKVKGDLQMGEALINVFYPGTWQIKDGMLYKGKYLMNNNHTMVDFIGRVTGDTCTIFQGDIRIATNVIRDGNRALGTRVSEEVKKVVLEEGQDYFGEAEVLGVKYQTGYKPIKDINGRNIGIWYVGASNQYVNEIFVHSMWNITSTIVLNLLMVLLILLFITKFIVKPIRGLAAAANRLALGDLDTEIKVQREDEIGYLARTFERMRVERKKAEKELRAAHQQLLDIIEFLPDATFVIDQEKKVIAWNRAIEEMTGVPKEKIIGKDNYASILPFYNSQETILVDMLFLNNKENKGNAINDKEKVLSKEFFLPAKDQGGEGTYLLVTAGPLFNNDGKLVGAIKSIRNITHEKLAEKKLRYLATHDALTGLPNRLFFEETISRAVAKAKRGQVSAILFIDLDNFKVVNDTLGHEAGDSLLVSLSGILKNNIREGDLLARLGGDEFVVLLDGASTEEAILVAEKLRSLINERELCLVHYKYCFNISLSIGIAIIDGCLSVHKLLSLADTALYKAKEGGRNRVVFLQAFEDEANCLSEANNMVTLIKTALKEDRFVLYYQPVVSVKTGQTMHYEVLVRLLKENDELIYPGNFIPIAESFGLMNQIDWWVVKSSLEVLASQPSLKLFVNLSAVSLSDDALLEYIENTLSSNNIAPQRLGFEVTETVAVKDLRRASNWITRLKRVGCQFALDDFGTGFSSFSYLKKLPIDYIKIDGSFIRNLHQDSTQYAFVQAINTVAQTLEKKTVAEFVENIDDLEKLRELQIDYAQGYYIGKPTAHIESATEHLYSASNRRVSTGNAIM